MISLNEFIEKVRAREAAPEEVLAYASTFEVGLATLKREDPKVYVEYLELLNEALKGLEKDLAEIEEDLELHS